MKPRLLIFINRLVVGGISNDVISLAYYLKEEFDILILYGEKEAGEEEATFLLERYPGLNVKKIAWLKKRFNPFYDILTFFRIYRIIKDFKCDILHTHGSKSGFMGRIAGRLTGVKCVVHTFHGHLFHSYYNRILTTLLIYTERRLSAYTHYIIATSKQQQEDLVHIYRIAPSSKVRIIDLGVDNYLSPRKHLFLNGAFRKKYMVSDDEIAIGIVARITAIKNFNLFTAVAEKILHKSEKQVKFFVIGDGVLKTEVQKALLEKNIRWCDANHADVGCQVIFTSWLPDIFQAMNALDIVILTSNNEGTGLSLAEAQLCGKPVVCTKVGGVTDTIVDYETGFFVEPGNADEFAEKLYKLICDKSLREEMGKKAAAFATERFSKEMEVKKTRELYQQCFKPT